MNGPEQVARRLYELQSKIGALGAAAQMQNTTVGGDAAVPVADVVTEAVVTNDAMPDVQEDSSDGNEGVSDLQANLSAVGEDLVARLEQAQADLEVATADLLDAQQDVSDAFGLELTGLSDRVDQIVVGANGTLILYSAEAPTADDKAPTGSTWWMLNEAENIVGQWQQTGTLDEPVWTPRQIESEVFANLDVGKLSAGQAAIAELVALKIAASTANIQTVNVANLFVTDGATMNQATINYLFANVVAAKKITADMLDVNSLNGVSVTGLLLKTAASGQRIEIQKQRIDVFGDAGAAPISIQGYAPDSTAGQLLITGASSKGSATASFTGADAIGTAWTNDGSPSSMPFNAYLTHGAAALSLGSRYLFAYDPENVLAYCVMDASDLYNVALTATRFRFKARGSNAAPRNVIAPMTSATGETRVMVQADDFRLRDGTSIGTDTGWVTSGFTVPSGVLVSGARIRRVGQVVSLVVDSITVNSLAIPTSGDVPNTAVLKVPDGFAPSYGQAIGSLVAGRMCSFVMGASGNLVLGSVVPDATQTGTITVDYNTSAGGTYLYG
ncbi:hypothetical protein DEI99_005330 [Curtobacterium sp. MCLR17_036]|uniref:hypothetical protein n=1 Tax=Curtobacterium sp. MCLR17_036 TaxID=2175620 RepID=UPI000DA9A10B|nr:hypothetical protein [Curtobacterium sp. MCLR17_036]WIE65961.1 hypothetical protein DEI99_005330 [Curtobacterium sp. MCLR17_036]